MHVCDVKKKHLIKNRYLHCNIMNSTASMSQCGVYICPKYIVKKKKTIAKLILTAVLHIIYFLGNVCMWCTSGSEYLDRVKQILKQIIWPGGWIVLCFCRVSWSDAGIFTNHTVPANRSVTAATIFPTLKSPFFKAAFQYLT